MKKFIQNYPEYQKLSGNVNKHVTLLQDLANITGERQLLLLSETEQELATNNDHSSAVKVPFSFLSFSTSHLSLPQSFSPVFLIHLILPHFASLFTIFFNCFLFTNSW